MNRGLWRHIAFWLAYLSLMGFLAGRYDLRFREAYLSELAQLPAKMVAAYLALWWIARSRATGQAPRLFFSVGLAVALAAMINRAIMYYLLYPAFFADEYSMEYWSLDRILYTCIDVGTAVVAVVALKLARHRIIGGERERRLVEERLQAELRFLRAQTNPHFLFNTLNNIYALARRESPRVAALVMRLSKLLRFMLYECGRPAIPLADEIRVVKDLIELEKLRYGEGRLQVSFEEETDDSRQAIAPLLLLPFVENAFKHGAAQADIAIALRLRDGVLDFRVSNSADAGEEDLSPGLGLGNVRRQLELLYPGAHLLEIIRQPERFTVHLNIQLNEYETTALSDR
jgi:two-component system LytT family sensor kinase